MAPQISEVALEINNETIIYVPNSLKFKKGDGKKVINANSQGGGSSVVTSARDFTEAMGMVTFELRPTVDNVRLTSEWFNNDNGNSITLSNQATGFAIAFTNMNMEEDPEITLSADGTYEITFKGDRGV